MLPTTSTSLSTPTLSRRPVFPSPQPPPQSRTLPLHLPQTSLQLLDPFLQPLDPLLGAGGELLDNLEDAPKSQDDDDAADLLEGPFEEDVEEEAECDDERVEDVEAGGEEAGDSQMRVDR
ncbi:hypothetical protein MRB53_037908 [Persea americana]|nr:hypothetical protein MRB53_037908 [Persea americana]